MQGIKVIYQQKLSILYMLFLKKIFFNQNQHTDDNRLLIKLITFSLVFYQDGNNIY